MYPYNEKEPLPGKLEYFLSQEGLCGILPNEITNLSDMAMHFVIGGKEGTISFEKSDELTSKQNENIDRLIKLKAEYVRICKEDHESCRSYDAIPETIELVRNNSFKWEKIAYCGDPWSIEDITKIIDNVFYSLQGCLMVKNNSDLWV